MELIEVEAFIMIARTGGFTAAARALHLSQPAVSRRIELLEREVGAPLFDRLRGGVRLTAAGDIFLPYAEQMLTAARDAAIAIRAVQLGTEGTVSLALVGTLASTDLTGRLRTFRETNPGVRLVLRTARSVEVSDLVRQGEVSLGLRYFTDSSSGLVCTLVHDEALSVVCAVHSPLGRIGDATVADLSGVPWLGFAASGGHSGEPFARILERQLIRLGLDEAEIVAVDSLTAQKRLIEADFGVGLLPTSSIEEELRAGTLRVLPISGMEASAPVYVLHRRNGFLGPAARQLLVTLGGNPPTEPRGG
ncbi:MAG: LysR family transcriptional regulator [Chloroflexia bacterium]|nr:LysR family transcriptional regulator [Chloroflexia bacterium]